MKIPSYLPPVLASVAFAGFAAVFAAKIYLFQSSVVEWARRDLRSRAELAAANLREPLETDDFRAIREFGEKLDAEGIRLSIASAAGGIVFDSDPSSDASSYRETSGAGNFRVTIGIPSSRVMEPFRSAVAGFALAGMVGIAGVFTFFLVTYRQRVRIGELKRAEEFRRNFVADVSHELKTPLTGIIGAVDMLEDAAGDNRGKLLAMIRRESMRLNDLAQRILSLARIERGWEALEKTPVDIEELVREIGERYGIRAECRGRGLFAECDRRLVEEAISNLVENARRYSGTDDILISATAGRNGVEIAVEDHGIGIPPKYADKVFERFYRVDPARAPETGGTGLGLPIALGIARLHGGSLTLAPAKPSGCRFTFSFGSSSRPV